MAKGFSCLKSVIYIPGFIWTLTSVLFTVTIGLGDGLLSALAAVSEPEVHDAMQLPLLAFKKKRRERGKDRRRRNHVEHRNAPSQTSEVGGDTSSSASSHPVEVRSALLDAYGQRRRVGDSVLSEQALAAEVVELLNNDSTFVRELHQQYLRKVQL
ncbi:hypothetical protein JB92DRAFT_3121375 [Gautieria morchelliformis]|nr:hypothetical protein JB92DRAFT_3121375 [Gautieria morchelliformis]